MEERLLFELIGLVERRTKLISFIDSERFDMLVPRDRELLAQQAKIMGEYQDILITRILNMLKPEEECTKKAIC